MPKTILIHSFHNGVGRSNMAANLAFLLAQQGQRVGIIDTDTKSPTIHYLFGVKEKELNYSLNDYLWGQCNIEQAAYNITAGLNAKEMKGQIIMVPANVKIGQTARILGNTQDVNLFNTGCETLMNKFGLDTLLVDTQPGLSKEALISITVADILVTVLRLNQRDYLGTGVAVDVVRQLDVPRIALIVNEVPSTFDVDEVKEKMEQTYNCQVAAVLPHADEMTALANKDIFAIRYPNHPMTKTLKAAASILIT